MQIEKHWRHLLAVSIGLLLGWWSLTHLNLVGRSVHHAVEVVSPFLWGAGLSFILSIPVNSIEKRLNQLAWFQKRRGLLRALSILLAVMGIFCLLYFLIFLVLPDFQETIFSFVQLVPVTLSRFMGKVLSWIDRHPEWLISIQQMDIDLGSLVQQIVAWVQGTLTDFIGSIFSISYGVVTSLFNGFIAFVFAITMLAGKETLILQAKKCIYAWFSLPWANYLVNVGKESHRIFTKFVSGQVLEGAILGGLVFVGMLIFSFPHALTIAAISGAMGVIPIFGAFFAAAIGTLLIVVDSPTQALFFLLFLIVVQQFEGNVIYPKVVGSSVGLPGIWTLVAVTVGGAYFGLTGMLLSVPVFSLAYRLISATVNHRLQVKQLKGDFDQQNLNLF